MGTLRLLEAVRILGLEKKTKFYQASTSELYGLVRENSTKRNHSFLSAVPLCRRQNVRLLDLRQLSRSLWHLRMQWNPLQS